MLGLVLDEGVLLFDFWLSTGSWFAVPTGDGKGNQLPSRSY